MPEWQVCNDGAAVMGGFMRHFGNPAAAGMLSCVLALAAASAWAQDKVTLRVWDSFNPRSVSLPVARQDGGITTVGVMPSGGMVSETRHWGSTQHGTA